jgi:hypothetical protein
MAFSHNLKCVFGLLLLPLFAEADGPYHIHPLSEQETVQIYTQALRDACVHADEDWNTSSFDPAAGYWGNGVSNERGIRIAGSMVLACATVLKYDDGLSASERQDLSKKVTAALRYATATHFTSNQKCTDGKQWGGMDRPGSKQWQSSYWTGSYAMGAWLIWDKLDPALRQDIERMVVAQDDLLATGNPPTNMSLDTKAEENGWTVPCLVLGELMFPTNPHAALWHQTALKYMMNTLCTAADSNSTDLVDGRAVKDWSLGANLYPDFTLENHNIFHPSYVGCSSYFLTQAALCYTYAHQPIPQAATHHLLDTWRMFQTVLLPWGESAYPQGMDWELHGLPFINLYAALATHNQDPYASRLEQCELQLMRTWQEADKGSLAFYGSKFGVNRHAINAEQLSFGLLAHRIFGPSAKPLTEKEAIDQEQGMHDYPYVDFIAQRTDKKFVSFSWKNKIMGLIIPLGDGHEDNPDFSTPIPTGLIGSFDLSPKGDVKMKVVDHSRQITPDHELASLGLAFETSGTVLLNGGRLKQTLRVSSLGSQTVVYEDRVAAAADVTVQSERGVPVGIENDEITGGIRVVTNQDGQTTFERAHPRKAVALSGSWANVDGRLGVVMVGGSGMSYAQASGYSPGISVCSDILYGSFSDHARQFKAGEEVAHRIVIFFVEVTPEQTAELAKSCKIETKPEGRVLQFKQPNGLASYVPLF